MIYFPPLCKEHFLILSFALPLSFSMGKVWNNYCKGTMAISIISIYLLIQCVLMCCIQSTSSFVNYEVKSKLMHSKLPTSNFALINQYYRTALSTRRSQSQNFNVRRIATPSRKAIASSTLLSSLPPTLDTIQWTPLILQTLSAFTTYIALVAFFDRPRGKLDIDHNSFKLQQSQVPNAGLGLYVTKSLPKGTILGSYPGVLRPSTKFLQKYETIPQTAVYTWRFTDNQYCIDPTNVNGELLDVCYGGTDDYPLSYFIHELLLRNMNVPTCLARINEPPLNAGGCNVRSDEDLERREVVFELSRDVVAGEELFMDYGLTYDRSGYQGSD